MPARPLLLRLLLATLLVSPLAAQPTPDEERPDQPVDIANTVPEAAIPRLPAGSVTVTFPAATRQTFRGFGASSKAGWTHSYGALPPERQAFLDDTLWRDARLNTLRVWFVMKDYERTPGERDLERVMPDSQVLLIRNAQARGLKHLVLGPCGVPPHMIDRKPFTRKNGTTGTSPELKPSARAAHAAAIADFIKDCREKHGIVFEATGVQNEPNTGNDCHFTAESFVASVKALRSALDARGLREVKIIGPETASPDRVAERMVAALQADPAAWRALAGLSTHSYNMAINEKLASTALQSDKEFWQTEASTPGREEPGDTLRAGTLAATVLSDLNHGVTHWIYFIGFAGSDPKDNGTRLVSYDSAVADDSWATVYYKTHYLAQLAATFSPGAVLRKGSAEPGGAMHWTYGRKPRVVAACARNPDGSFGVGIANFTWNAYPDRTDFQKANRGEDAQAFNVTIVIDELKSVARHPLRAVAIGPVGGRRDLGEIIAENGRFTVPVGPMELVSLR